MIKSAHAALQLQQQRRNMQFLGAFILAIVVGLASSTASAFTAPASTSYARSQTSLFSGGNDEASTSSSSSTTSAHQLPQVFATGYSNNPDLHTALQQAVNAALAALPPLNSGADGADDGLATRGRSDAKIDLAFVTASSLYNASPATVVPAVLSSASVYGQGIDKLIGCTSGGTISSVVGAEGGEDGAASSVGNKAEGSAEDVTAAATAAVRECLPVETEGVPGVSVTLALLPDVEVSVSSACIWFVFIANCCLYFVRFHLPTELYISSICVQSFSLKCMHWHACMPTNYVHPTAFRRFMSFLKMSPMMLGAFRRRIGIMRSV